MTENVSRLSVKSETGAASPFYAFDKMRRQIDQMFEDFGGQFWSVPTTRSAIEMEPVWRRDIAWEKVPAVDVIETEKSYEISAELPGMDEKEIDVTVANGVLTIKGEKKEVKEEKQKDHYVSERHYGSFARSFQIPGDADAGKIEAKFQKGVLAVILPKKAEAQRSEQKIAVKTV